MASSNYIEGDYNIGPQPIDSFVINELTNRETNQGMNVSTINLGNGGNYGNPYCGPLACWQRVCSNGIGQNHEIGNQGRAGFIMGGVAGFEQTYGQSANVTTNTSQGFGNPILGFIPGGGMHQISNPGVLFKPSPGIKSIDVTLEGSTYRTAKINWTCHSFEQLDYMENYFLTPGVTIIVEWGWNNYNLASLADLTDLTGNSPTITNNSPGQLSFPNSGNDLTTLWTNDWAVQNNCSLSNGNYDMAFGLIRDYSFKMNKLGGYDCETVISTSGGIYASLAANYLSTTVNGNKKEGLVEFIDKSFTSIPSIISGNLKQIIKNSTYEKQAFISPGLDKSHLPKQSSYCWGNSTNDFYVPFGYVIEIVNLYLSHQLSDDAPSKIETDIYTGDSWISGHPNLKSTDSRILLVPNERAPLPALSRTGTDNPNNYVYSKISGGSSDVDNVIINDIGANQRQDLSLIISNGSLKFPDFDKYQGFGGLLNNLYVSKKAVTDAFNGSEKILDGLMTLLNQMSGASAGIWDFQYRSISRGGHGNTKVTIIDTNFRNIGDATDSYSFKLGTNRSNIIDFDFNIKLANEAGLQVMFGNANTIDNSTFNNLTQAPASSQDKRDRLLATGFVKSTTSSDNIPDLPASNTSTTPTKVYSQNQSSDADGAFYVSTGGPPYMVTNGIGIYSLTEPNSSRMKSWVATANPPLINTGVMPGTRLKLTILGISGIRVMDYFYCYGLTSTYSPDVIMWVVTNVSHKIENGEWTTEIESGVMPRNVSNPPKSSSLPDNITNTQVTDESDYA